MTSFAEFDLPPHLLKGLEKAGFATPTPIQEQAIPHQLKGRDILGIAQTGSGKTAAFGLPILAGISQMEGRPSPMTARALILAPTRELAVQIEESLRSFAFGSRLTTALVLGGMSRHAQIQKLAKGVDVIIATPGRLQDLIADRKLRLNETRWLVLDEADRMLDMGFIKPVTEIAKTIGAKRQTALFSATMPPAVAELAQGLLRDPIRVEAAPQGTTVTKIEQSVIMTPTAAKRAQLRTLLADATMSKVIVFSRTKHGADRVAKNLELDGFSVAAIHGNKSQNARQAALKGFASGQVRLLVATDIAARGIDVPNITHVINFELPDDAENYVHRIGRTGRNGASGIAITLCDGSERGKLRDIERLIRKTLPVSGDMAIAAGPRDSQPAPTNRRPAGARTGQARPPRGSAATAPQGDKAWWAKLEEGEGKPAAAGKAKPRWGKTQKDAAKVRRAPAGNRARRDNVA